MDTYREVAREWDDIATDEGLTLSEIAAATGGTAFKNSNDLFTGLQRAFADGREYYTLAYVSTNEAQDGKFRKIAVQVRDQGGSQREARLLVDCAVGVRLDAWTFSSHPSKDGSEWHGPTLSSLDRFCPERRRRKRSPNWLLGKD